MHMKMSVLLLRVAVAAAAVTLFAGTAAAQSYPTKPIRLVVPFAPGGIFDYIARLVSPSLTETFGHPVVVDNRPGGGGMIAMSTVSKAAPDGYTVLLADPSFVINPTLHPKPTYSIDDFTAVSVITTASLVVAVHANVAAKSLQQLIELAGTTKLSYGSAGVGTTPHIAGELLRSRAKVELLHVPYKGIGPAVSALVSEQVHVTFGSVAATQGFIRDGRLRALGTTGEKRASALPNIPTVAELGYPGYAVSVWGTVFVPKGTPQGIVNRLNGEFNKVLQVPEVRKGLDKAAIEPLGTTPAQAAAFVNKEFAKYADVIKSAGITAE
jgi:tripartite-type tricarboxylate transporter receptor subunit TctC